MKASLSLFFLFFFGGLRRENYPTILLEGFKKRPSREREKEKKRARSRKERMKERGKSTTKVPEKFSGTLTTQLGFAAIQHAPLKQVQSCLQCG